MDWNNIIAFAGTAIGTFGGIIAANRLVQYRLEQLEKKVEKHNNLVERMVVCEEEIKSAKHRIDDLEKGA